MNKIYVYDCSKKYGEFNINNYFLCDIKDNVQAMHTGLFLKCEFVRIVMSERTVWIQNGSLLNEAPDWYTPDTVKNV